MKEEKKECVFLLFIIICYDLLMYFKLLAFCSSRADYALLVSPSTAILEVQVPFLPKDSTPCSKF